MHCQIVIPARLRSSRLPEKLLRRVGGKSILQHTHDAASRSRLAGGVVVAVDDPRLAAEVASFGGRAVMTSVDCPSGTDRIAEVAAQLPETEVFVNVQGDEPEIEPEVIDAVGSKLIGDPAADIATAATAIREAARLGDANCVKVVMGGGGRAIYFSRAAVPHLREGGVDTALAAEPPLFWHHVGIYAYRRDFLAWFAAEPPSRLEQAEKLEQLRAIEAGKRVVVAEIEAATAGIDTPADLKAFAARYSR